MVAETASDLKFAAVSRRFLIGEHSLFAVHGSKLTEAVADMTAILSSASEQAGAKGHYAVQSSFIQNGNDLESTRQAFYVVGDGYSALTVFEAASDFNSLFAAFVRQFAASRGAPISLEERITHPLRFADYKTL